jgi:hypothetical protein
LNIGVVDTGNKFSASATTRKYGDQCKSWKDITNGESLSPVSALTPVVILFTVKKVNYLPVSSRDVTNQTLPARE